MSGERGLYKKYLFKNSDAEKHRQTIFNQLQVNDQLLVAEQNQAG